MAPSDTGDGAATQQPLISRKHSQNPAAAAMVPKESVLLLRRLTTMMQTITLEFTDLGCAYNTGQGVKVVLQVGVGCENECTRGGIGCGTQ